MLYAFLICDSVYICIRIVNQNYKFNVCPMFQVKKIPALQACRLDEAAELLAQQPAFPIRYNNWPVQYPYSPQVTFNIAHNDREIFIRFDVSENYTMARIREDNGQVWTDSCVEFFLSTDNNGYYNFEFTCIGKALSGFRQTRENAEHANPETMQSIGRLSSLGTENFEEQEGDNRWWLVVAIPATALFKHNFKNLSGLKAKANLYKCGDHLSKPHFLSWQPIDTPEPNFHVPQFFTGLEFQ